MREPPSERIVVIGGGVAGLSIAARVAHAGLPVTVLEASQIGSGASTRNQGWLHSGAWFAPQQVDLAEMCYTSLQQTLRFCPEALEPGRGAMVYLVAEEETDPGRWTEAWASAGIPYEELASEQLFERFPALAISQARHAFQLPDRAVRTDVLLARLAREAERAGAELRSSTPVARLVEEEERVLGVETHTGETIPARLVLLAGNARGGRLLPGFGAAAFGPNSDIALVALKTHLVGVQPEVGEAPLCVLDADGFNHIPHRPTSVFGTSRWLPARHGEDERADAEELERLWQLARRFFPDLDRGHHQRLQWAGTTVQAMRVDQIEAGQVPLPTVIDHAHEPAPVENLLSVFPGRGTLWAHLAEQATGAVLAKVGPRRRRSIAAPPWGTPARPAAIERLMQ